MMKAKPVSENILADNPTTMREEEGIMHHCFTNRSDSLQLDMAQHRDPQIRKLS
jgi:hypothetical protein